MESLLIEIAGINVLIKSRRGICVDEALRPFVKAFEEIQADIADKNIEKNNVELFEIAELENNRDYISGLLGNAKIVFEDEFTKRYTANQAKGEKVGNEIFEVIEHNMNRNGNLCRLYVVKGVGENACEEDIRNCRESVRLYADEGFYEMFETEGKIYKFLDVENLLIRHNAFYLHSSFVKVNGKGIAFSADSGVGKSTQADLWKKYRNAKIINGDKTIIKYENGKFVGWGSPYAGSSGIYENKCAQIEAICFLKQSEVNQIRKMSRLEAISQVFVKSMIRSFDRDRIGDVTRLIDKLTQTVKIYEFSCTKKEDAVLFLEGELKFD